MKQNKKTNKFKLVKWKKKLVPTLFGTFISLNPLMIVALKDDKSSKSSSQSADRNSVENEKTRIQGLSKQTITKSVIKVNANSLTAQELGIDKGKIEGVKHTITHKEVTSDTNDLDVSIKITKGSQTLTTTMKVKIIGINATKDIETVKALFNSLENPSNGKYGTESTLSDALNTLPSSLSSKTTPETIGFEDASKGKRNGVNVSFQVKNHSNAVGTLTVEVTLSKNQGKTEKFEFVLKGYKVDTGDLVAITSKNVNQIIEEARKKRIKLSSNYYIKINEKINWPKNLSKINWGKLQGLTKHNTPFKGDISNFNIFSSTLKDIDVSQVTKWPINLLKVNWNGVKGININQLINSKIPMIGDISLLNISNSNLKNVDISKVTKWPANLQGINWNKAIGIKSDQLIDSEIPMFGDISNLDISSSNLNGVDVSKVTKWPKNLSGINWEGIKGLTKDNTPFKGDISNLNISNSTLKDVVVIEVTKWPKNLSGINWEGIKGLTKDNTPFKDNISNLNIFGSKFKDVDVSKVTKWPKNLSGINWEGIKGLTKDNTPFKGDISNLNISSSKLKNVDVSQVTKWPTNLKGIKWEGVIGIKPNQLLKLKDGSRIPMFGDISNLDISSSNLNGVDVSKVTKWPKNLSGINWEGIKGLTKDNTPFKGDISNLNISGSKLKNVDVSQVTKWPANLKGIKWEWVIGIKPNQLLKLKDGSKIPMIGDISNLNISGSKLENVDVSRVTKWPKNLLGINWEGIKGLTKDNTLFKGDISNFRINGIFVAPEKSPTVLKGIDISQVTKWPKNLSGINWEMAQGFTKDNTPFKGDISNLNISGSKLKNVDVSQVTKWPANLKGIKWEWVIGIKPNQLLKLKDGSKIPMIGDISNLNISGSKLENVDVSRVTKWPKNLSGINWEGIKGLTKDNTLFKGDISNFRINGIFVAPEKSPTVLKGIDISQVTKWPKNLSEINWNGAIGIKSNQLIDSRIPMFGDISNLNISGSKLKNVDVSKVTKWPTNLFKINWEGVKRLTKDNTPFKGDISNLNIFGSFFKDVDFSQVTQWPKYLFGINWEGVKEFTKDNKPFKGDISNFNISNSIFKDVDFSQVTKWPANLQGINWNGAIGIKSDQLLDSKIPMIGDISNLNISGSKLENVDVFRVTKWPKNLSGINWEMAQGFTKDNTPFKGDISNLNIFGSIFKGIDFSQVTKWPKNLSGINWEMAQGFTKDNTPFKGDISNLNIFGSIFKGIDFSQVTKWPKNLSGINWEMAQGFTKDNTPFKGDISNLNIFGSIFKGIDFSQVTKWPKNLSGINWEMAQGFTKDNTPFKGDISNLNIFGSIFKGIDFSQVTKWPKNLSGIKWEWVIGIKPNQLLKLKDGSKIPMIGDISNLNISGSKLENVDVSRVTKWPKNLSGINWEGIKGLTKDNTLFKGDISNFRINGIFVAPEKSPTVLKGIDISQVTKWPKNLSEINWNGAIGIKSNQLIDSRIPMFGDISNLNISGSKLKGVDVSKVTKWPTNLSGINWDAIQGLIKDNTPFKGNISNLDIFGSILKDVDISEVIQWPKKLSGINWDGAKGLTKDNTPFKGDISNLYIFDSKLKDVDFSQVTKWPKNLSGINWEMAQGFTKDNTPFKGDISNLNISSSKLKNVDVSKVTKWPANLKGIKWEGVIGIKPNQLLKLKDGSRIPMFGDISNLDISSSNLNGVDVSKVTKWPNYLNGINWEGVKGLTKDNTPFKGDISNLNIFGSIFKGIDFSQVTKWPNYLNGINWKGVIGILDSQLLDSQIPMFGDISNLYISGSNLKDVDVSKVTKWPNYLNGINWEGVKGLTKDNTPFKGDISSLFIYLSVLKGIDVLQVTNWPKDLSWINWSEVKGLTNDNTPFKGDISNLDISDSKLKDVDVSKVTKWPTNLSGINWDGAIGIKSNQLLDSKIPMIGDISLLNISGSKLENVDVSQVTKWPTNLKGIKWEGVIGIKPNQLLKLKDGSRIPMFGDISNLDISNSDLKDVDVSYVTKWPANLQGIKWEGIVGIQSNQLLDSKIPMIGDISLLNILDSNLKDVDVSKVTKWPTNLQGINWEGIKGLTKDNTLFKGDISNFRINGIFVAPEKSPTVLKGIDISQVTKWPANLQGIKWEGIVRIQSNQLLDSQIPMFGDISNLNISGSKLKDVDVSQVTKWPKNLLGINWESVKGLTKDNTPFKGDISNFRINGIFVGSKKSPTVLKGVDVSEVTKWPKNLSGINWEMAQGFTKDNTPFKGDISNLNISGSKLKNVDVSQVTKWPANLKGIKWEWVIGIKPNQLLKLKDGSKIPMIGDISNLNISGSKLENVDVSRVTKWPKNLSGINWEGIKGLTKDNTLFKGDISNFRINGIFVAPEKSPTVLKGIDISQVTKWPKNLSEINWNGAIGIKSNQLIDSRIPMFGDISNLNISGSKLKGVDVSKVTKWPTNLSGINWDAIQGLIKDNTPFKGNISNLDIFGSILKDVDISEVIQWPKKLSGINWDGAKGLTKDNTPFKGDISNLDISNSNLKDVDVSKVTKWPTNLQGIKLEGIVGIQSNQLLNSQIPMFGDISNLDISGSKLKDVDVSKVTKWPTNLQGINWEGIKGLTKDNTLFKGDISNFRINGIFVAPEKSPTVLKGIDISQVTKWPANLQGIKWEGIVRIQSNQLLDSQIPMFGDISNLNISGSKLKNVNVSQVTKWPKNLLGINWESVKGLTKDNTPFKGDISNFRINGIFVGSKKSPTVLKGVDVSEVTKWPKNLSGINWEMAQGFTKDNTPFKGDISNLNISSSKLKNVDVSQVTKWPANLKGIKWEGVIGIKPNQLLKLKDGSRIPMFGDISNLDISSSNLNGVDVSKVTKWPKNLSGINWEGIKGLTKDNTLFKGDISNFRINGIFVAPEKSPTVLKGIDISQVTKWPKNLSEINWNGAIGIKSNQLIDSRIPMFGDISNLNISGSKLKGVDVSKVTKWPTNLLGINWEGVKGLTQDNTPFKKNISNLQIYNSILKGVDVSQVTQWPTNLSGINWDAIQGLIKDNTPFKGNISNLDIFGSILKDVDISEVIQWPKKLSGINWDGAKGLTKDNTPFKGDISNLDISNSNLKDVDVSEVTKWPTNLSGINWEGAKGLTKDNTPFKGDISNLDISNSNLKGIDVSEVTKWPTNLSGINWEGVKGLTKDNTPFKDDISNLDIFGSILKGVDVSQVTQWPKKLSGINWEGVKGLTKDNTPFKGDISNLDIFGSILKGVDVSYVTKWPINLKGISWEGVIDKRVSQANIDINIVKALFDEFKNVDSKKITTLKDRKIILPSSLISKTTPEAIGFKDPSKDKRNGVNVSFSVKTANDVKGEIVILVTLFKTPGNKQTIEFILTGYQTQVKRIASNTEDIEKEKLRIERLDLAIINKLLSSINKNSLTKSELALGETPKGISYEIIHNKITREGEFDITLKIKKGSQEIETTRKVLISYMNKLKQKVSSPKVSGLSKGSIAGIVISVSFVTFGIAFIIYRFLKLKKIK